MARPPWSVTPAGGDQDQAHGSWPRFPSPSMVLPYASLRAARAMQSGNGNDAAARVLIET